MSTYRKLTIILLIIIITLLILGLFRQPQIIGSDVYVVKKNDTLWGIAEKYAPNNVDKLKYISELYNLNDALTCDIYQGQEIKIPLYK